MQELSLERVAQQLRDVYIKVLSRQGKSSQVHACFIANQTEKEVQTTFNNYNR